MNENEITLPHEIKVAVAKWRHHSTDSWRKRKIHQSLPKLQHRYIYQSIFIESKKKHVWRDNHIPARYLGSHDLNNSVFYENSLDLFFLGGNEIRNQGSQDSTLKHTQTQREDQKYLILKKSQNEKTWKIEVNHIFSANGFLLLSI